MQNFLKAGSLAFLLFLATAPSGADEKPACAMQGNLPKPVISTHMPPRYPGSASARHQQGVTAVTVTVGTEGVPIDASVTQSSGSEELDSAAVSSAKTYRWEPLPADCKPGTAQALIITGWHIGKPPKPRFGIFMPDSAYPSGAIERSEMGDTYLKLTIGDDGSVKDGSVAYSSGYADLDNAALAALEATPDAMKGRPSGTYIILARWKMSPHSPSAERLEIITSR
ncbi:MAG TPA: TonB family protein [Rhizomicrobium sp.]|jgi:TonB family protein|nr:TonB family protein [Rhizomicrobium sp.]